MNVSKLLTFAVILIFALAGICLPPLVAQGPDSKSSQDPLLDTLNGEFRAEYQQALGCHAGTCLDR